MAGPPHNTFRGGRGNAHARSFARQRHRWCILLPGRRATSISSWAETSRRARPPVLTSVMPACARSSGAPVARTRGFSSVGFSEAISRRHRDSRRLARSRGASWPRLLPISGNLLGPKTTKATTAMRMSSGIPIPNMARVSWRLRYHRRAARKLHRASLPRMTGPGAPAGLLGLATKDAAERGRIGVPDARRDVVDRMRRGLEEVDRLRDPQALGEALRGRPERLRDPARERATTWRSRAPSRRS